MFPKDKHFINYQLTLMFESPTRMSWNIELNVSERVYRLIRFQLFEAG